jgi:hypothetical protein
MFMENKTSPEVSMIHTISFINQYGDLQLFETVRGWDAAHESRLRLRSIVPAGTRISIREIR